MPPIVVYISDSSPSGPVLDGRWVAFQHRWLTKTGNTATGTTPIGELASVFNITAFSFDDVLSSAFFNIDFATEADAQNFENDIAYLAVGLSANGEATSTYDTIQANTPVYLDMTQGARTGTRITWANSDTGVSSLFSNLSSGDFTFLVAHSSGNAPSVGVVTIASTSLTPNVNDTITLSSTSTGDDADWVKWTITGTEGVDWSFANGTDEYSASPQLTILTSNSISVLQTNRWEGTGIGATTWTIAGANNALTITPVASETVYVDAFRTQNDPDGDMNVANSSGWWLSNNTYSMTNTTGQTINLNATYPRVRYASDGTSSDGSSGYFFHDTDFANGARDTFLAGFTQSERNRLRVRHTVSSSDATPTVPEETALGPTLGWLRARIPSINSTFDPIPTNNRQFRLQTRQNNYASLNGVATGTVANASGAGTTEGWAADMASKIEIILPADPVYFIEDSFSTYTGSIAGQLPDVDSPPNRSWSQSGGAYQVVASGQMRPTVSAGTGYSFVSCGVLDKFTTYVKFFINSSTQANRWAGAMTSVTGSSFERLEVRWETSQYVIKRLHWNGSAYDVNENLTPFGITFNPAAEVEIKQEWDGTNVNYVVSNDGNTWSGSFTPTDTPNGGGFYSRYNDSANYCTSYKVD